MSPKIEFEFSKMPIFEGVKLSFAVLKLKFSFDRLIALSFFCLYHSKSHKEESKIFEIFDVFESF